MKINKKQLIHIIGIGGIGMSGIAEILNDLGYSVQGSDIGLNSNILRFAILQYASPKLGLFLIAFR